MDAGKGILGGGGKGAGMEADKVAGDALLTFIKLASLVTFCIALPTAAWEYIELQFLHNSGYNPIAVLGFGLLIGLLIGVPFGLLMTSALRRETFEMRPVELEPFQDGLEQHLSKVGYQTIAPEGLLKVYSPSSGKGGVLTRLLPVPMDLVIWYSDGTVRMSGPNMLIKDLRRHLERGTV